MNGGFAGRRALRRLRLTAAVLCAAAMLAACLSGGNGSGLDRSSEFRDSPAVSVSMPPVDSDAEQVIIVADGLRAGWRDYGWSSTTDAGGSVEIELGDYGGWIVAHPGLVGSFSELSIRLTGPSKLGDRFLDVTLGDENGTVFPTVTPSFVSDAGELVARVPMYQLLAGSSDFDRVVLSASEAYESPTTVVVKHLALVVGDPDSLRPSVETSAAASVDCSATPVRISPHIYGTARPLETDNEWQWSLRLPSRRWGGNPTSRYNWEIGAWNTASDYYWQNVAVGADRPGHEIFLEENARNGVLSVVTVPMLGWVAKDKISYSFSVDRLGAQQEVDPQRTDIGNGVSLSGELIRPPDTELTSVPFTPASAAAWVRSMEETEEAGGPPAPFMYILDNEPMLWHETHRDVFPDPLGYDELLRRSIDYAEVIRAEAPDALIAGPAAWGWPAYFYSAVDAAEGFNRAPDRRAHQRTPLIEWYLQQMRNYEESTGVRLLDVLDVHFYPQDGSYSRDVSAEASAQRIRATRSIWDPGYEDESWIDDRVELIPRMQEWVDENYPGTKLSIGEYSFGAEADMSGGLAQAEVLGRFGQEGLYSAYYWVSPTFDSPVYWAFRAYRDYDSAGSQFGELSVPADADRPMSLFASTTESGDRHILVALNTSPTEELAANIGLADCERSIAKVYQYTGAPGGFSPADADLVKDSLALTLPPYSISVVELR